MVLAAAEGSQDREIAAALGIGRQTAARWRRRFLTMRLRGVDEPSAPRIELGRLSDEQVRAILRVAAPGGMMQHRRSSTRAVARAAGVSHSTVRRVWEAHGVRPRRFEAWPPRPDPTGPSVPSDVVGLFLHPPDFAIAFSLDPRPRDGVGRASQPSLPSPAASYLAPLLQSWPAPSPPLGIGRLRPLMAFGAAVSLLDRRPDTILVVATLPGLVSTQEFLHWRRRHPNVQLELQPSAEAWRARIHPALAALGKRGGGSRRFGSRGELVRSIRLFLEGYTPSSGPFQWVAPAADLARHAAVGRLRYDLSATGHVGFMRTDLSASLMTHVHPPELPLREMARALLRKSLDVRKGERVTIECWSSAVAPANALVIEALRLGAQPLLLYQDEPTYWAAARDVRAADLARVGAHVRAALERSDVFISFFGPSDRERFHALPRPLLLKLGEYQDVLYAVAAKAAARSVQLALGRVSDASARMYGVEIERWRRELVEATMVDPNELRRRGRRLAERLATGREVTIRHANGTHLRLGLRHRPPQVSDGKVERGASGDDWNLVQLPAGVVLTALDEQVADGVFRSNVANSVGVMDTVGEVRGGTWTFEQGRLVRFDYEEGRELFAQSYDRAGAGRERPGILSIGLNERIEIAPLLQDQAYGAVTLQLGKNDRLGGRTRTPWWAWLILRGADISVDGVRIVRAGRLVG
jgi:leucyl aminopeptidase (aminopeptidase T)